MRSAAGIDDFPKPFAFAGEDFVLAFGLGFELGENGGGLAFRFEPSLLRLGLGIDDDFGLLGFGWVTSTSTARSTSRWGSSTTSRT